MEQLERTRLKRDAKKDVNAVEVVDGDSGETEENKKVESKEKKAEGDSDGLQPTSDGLQPTSDGEGETGCL